MMFDIAKRYRMAGMLQGYRVVELAIWVAGPAAGGLLSDWGADVIKVEAPAGDPMRKLFGTLGIDQARVPPYELDNRGKRCVLLDLTTDEGRVSMEELLSTADVFITNLRLDALGRLGLEPEAVRSRHPRLIYSIVTGYGLEGPDRDRAGYDIGAFWARSSLAHASVPPGELPPALRSGVGDHATGMTLTAGILAALLNRERTGEGRLVHTSLLRTGIYLNGWDISIRQYFGKLASTRPRTRNAAPLVNCYQASDGRGFWLLGLEQDRHWPTLLAAMERQDLASDERFLKVGVRAKNCEALVAVFDEIFSTRTYDDWVARFDANDVWWAPINSIADVLQDTQAIASGAFIDMPVTDGEAPYQGVASPLDFSDFAFVAGEVRALGSDNDTVL
jgi:crotonobetainyl-CoA:carnitine CoA-transferase CaiB-like acyl-CoA transferase